MTMESDSMSPWAVLDMMEIPHLERFLADGARFEEVGVSDEAVQSYANLCAMRIYGPPVRLPDGRDGMDEINGFFLRNFVRACTVPEDGDPDHITFTDDGRVFIQGDFGPLEVTETSIRHWQWMLLLTCPDRSMAEGMLAAVPAEARATAVAHATSPSLAEDATFLEMVAPLIMERDQ